MKANIQIRTGDFEYINREIEVESDEGAVEAFTSLKTAFKRLTGVGDGLSDKDFNAAIDEFLNTNKLVNGTELYSAMNEEQQRTMQTLKRAFKRIEAKQNNNV